MGFIFKEEIVWDKRLTTAPCTAISRVHETISIHTKKTGTIRRTKVPYVEQRQYDIGAIVDNIRRIKKACRTEMGLDKVLEYLKSGKLYDKTRKSRHCVTIDPETKGADRTNTVINSIKNGMNEQSIIKYHEFGITTSSQIQDAPRVLKIVNSLNTGMNEKSIIELTSKHYKLQHPTEKPVRLAERILALISDPGDTIYDPFMGSGSFGVACIRTGRKYIGSEKKQEYFDIACNRIKQAVSEDCLWQV